MRYRVRHSTIYEYEGFVLHGRHIAHQRLRNTERQTVIKSVLTSKPAPAWWRAGVDYFGNETDALELLEQHDRLHVEVSSLVDVLPRKNGFELMLFREGWEQTRDRIASDESCAAARPFKYDSPLVRRHPDLLAYATKTFREGRTLYDAVNELNHRIFTEFSYEPLSTDVSTPLAQVLREKRGVCQDFAHVAVGILRSLGLAARYVSGYLVTRPPPGKPRLIGADASHAWASVFIPDWGWLDFDPTNDVLPDDRHVVVGWGRDFSDVSPLKGVVLGGGRHVVKVGVDVIPQNEEVEARPAAAEQPSQSQSQSQS